MNKRRVVVTGMGMLTPLGNSVSETWDAIVQGRSGVGKLDIFDVSEYVTQICASVRNFDSLSVVSAKDSKKMGLFIQYALAAANEAIKDANLIATEENCHRIGVAVGSGNGGLPVIERCHDVLRDQGPRKVTPFFVPSAIINLAPGYISIQNNFKGPNISIVTACSTGTHNIGYAARSIQYGDADIMIAGGSEMSTCPLGVAGFNSLRALSKRNDAPEKASRPWDRDRDGFVMGEGAGILVLEEYEHAKKRGAKIYAELVGFGASADAYHITSPDEEGSGAHYSMLNAINDAKLNPVDIDYVNAHATSTPAGDALEILAIKKTFGDHAYKFAVSSTKSMIGHLLGAAGAVEAIFSILAIRDNVAPPTINLDNPDEGCDINLVPHVAQHRTINIALSNSFGFGGTNGTLVFKRI